MALKIEKVDSCELWRIWRNRKPQGNNYGYPVEVENPTRAVKAVLRGRLVDARARSSHFDVYLVDDAMGKNPVLIGTVTPLNDKSPDVCNHLYLCQPMGTRNSPNECRARVYHFND